MTHLLTFARQAAICLRVVNPSLVRMCCTWFCAVRSEMTSLSAIWRFVRPSATSLATSSSRGLNAPRRLAARWARSAPVRSTYANMPSARARWSASFAAAKARSGSPGPFRATRVVAR